VKIGLDIHGVIDRFPKEFSLLTRRWVEDYGHEVHVVTGESWATAKPQVDAVSLSYTHHFSIVDHHRDIGTPMTNTVVGQPGWWMDEETWNRSKGDYATRVGLDIHFEDSLEYAAWFPPSCTFVHAGKNFGVALPVLGDFLHAWDLLGTGT